jgi:hypothetical protein
MAEHLGGGLTPTLVTFVLVANLAPGLAAGASFVRFGIEAAMVSHLATGAILLTAEHLF